MENQTTAELAILIALNCFKEKMYIDDRISKNYEHIIVNDLSKERIRGNHRKTIKKRR